MDLNKVYQLHMQLLEVYEKNQISAYSCGENVSGKGIDYYYRQLNFFCINKIERVFVLNQLIKLYEKGRMNQISWCINYLRASNSCDNLQMKDETE